MAVPHYFLIPSDMIDVLNKKKNKMYMNYVWAIRNSIIIIDIQNFVDKKK